MRIGFGKDGRELLAHRRRGPVTKAAQHFHELGRRIGTIRERYFDLLPGLRLLVELRPLVGQHVAAANLAEAKGKQKPDKYVIHEGEKKTTLTAQEFREKARDYLSQLVNSYPQSKFKDEALENLKSLGGAKPKLDKP